ncbi:hypothetical protein QAD02_004565 [Eretmocerus hayati]|uniref:Uncharacterized protein n=1 Tax=Eretmocerus hayati TaxID=131215 RepID=A0ACC2NR43_9HYME|nr:hypothetical protein QAD02_004565 [Eretmocerus hayati]
MTYYANVGMVAFAANGIRKDVMPDTPPSTAPSEDKYKIIISKELLADLKKEIVSTEPSGTSKKMTTRIGTTTQSYLSLRSSQPLNMTTQKAVESNTKRINLFLKSFLTTVEKNKQLNEELTLKSTRSIQTTISTITTSNDTSLLGHTPSTTNRLVDETSTSSTRPSVIEKIAQRTSERR